MKKIIEVPVLCLLAFFFNVVGMSKVWAQDVYPSAEPVMTIEEDGGDVDYESYSGSASINAHFKSNVQNIGGYTAYYEWVLYEPGQESSPLLLRYDQNIDYVFNESGTFYVKLLVTFIQGSDTIEYSQENPFSVEVSTSKLEMPNAFSPNGDGMNDIYKVKEGYQSIISFHAYIFNRWGKKLYEWTDIDSGWDGTCNGRQVKDGVYFCLVKAKGADGKNYSIKTDVNLLRGNGKEGTDSGE